MLPRCRAILHEIVDSRGGPTKVTRHLHGRSLLVQALPLALFAGGHRRVDSIAAPKAPPLEDEIIARSVALPRMALVGVPDGPPQELQLGSSFRPFTSRDCVNIQRSFTELDCEPLRN